MALKRVACLYRVSTKSQLIQNRQAEHGAPDRPGDDIPMQTKACAEFIKKQSTWKLEREYAEKGVSGYHKSADERDTLVQLKKDAAAGKFDILLVFMFDRLGRREDETPFIVEWLVQQGIEVWSVNEGQQCFNDHVDKLINYVRYWQSSGESEHTSMRVAEKHNQLVKEGKFRGGVAPYGYTLVYSGEYNKKGYERKKLVIHEPEATVVRRIFNLSCDVDIGSYKMAKILNNEGVPTRTGRNWTVQVIIRMLRNPIYKGDYVTGKVRVMRGKKVAAPKESWVHSREPVESLIIVTPSTWEQANENISIRDTKSIGLTSVKSDFLLSHVAYCGYCNAKMYPRTSPIKRQLKGTGEVAIYRSRYYSCPKKSRQGDCNGYFQYGTKRIEAAVLDEIYTCLDNINTIDISWLARSQKARLEKEHVTTLKPIVQKITSFKKEVARLEEEILKCLMGESTFTEKQLSEVIGDKSNALLALENERDSIIANTKATTAYIDELMAHENTTVSWKDEFTRADAVTQKELIGIAINRVHISRESVDITFMI